MLRTVLVVFLIAIAYVVQCQEATPDSLQGEFEYSYLLLDTTPIPDNVAYKPVIGIGMGTLTFKGDIQDNYSQHPLIGRNAVFFNVSRNINKNFKANFNVTFGQMSGTQLARLQNLNFKTQVLIGGISVQYNFRNFYKTKFPLNPYINIGIESFEFNSKADMYDAEGRKYHWWSDGTIRDREESVENELTSIMLRRDYKYETDLRELNLDGLGKYPMVAFGIPIDVGIELKVNTRLTFKSGVTFHYNFNDNVDNFTFKGSDDRQGSKRGDHYLFTYVTLQWDLFTDPPMTIYDRHYMEVEFKSLDTEDEDGDGVVDLWDEDARTPQGAKVDSRGRPIDSDDDGIPDYRDKEVNSAKRAIVDLDGVTMTEDQQIAASYMKPGIKSDRICEIYPSLCEEEGEKKFRITYMDIPEKFASVDKNKDGYISVDELNSAIDQFFDMNSPFTLDDLYELTDFFFEQ